MFRNKKQTGFTLIEMMTSIGIIALISAIFIVNYKAGNRNSSLTLATQKIASDLRLAQTKSLGGELFGISTTTPSWGIYFNMASTSEYLIFADLNNDNAFSPDEFYKKFTLPQDITIFQLYAKGILVPDLTVNFLPPSPVTFINNDPGSNAQIYLKDIYEQQRSCSVNFTGLIDPN